MRRLQIMEVSEVSEPGQTRYHSPKEGLSAPQIARREGLMGLVDLRNLGMVLFGFVLTLVLVPPVRTFPMDDDWVYSQSVKGLLAGAYKPHEFAEALALGHITWGALFSSIFGYSYTILSIATLTMSIMGLVLFYLLMRHLNVGSTQALLGTALLGCNPIYVYLSYSFMTDVTFLTYMFAACLCYVRGAQRYGQYWFWLGSLATALAYLTRQIGIFVVLAALLYLWWSRKWSWQSALAIAAIPVLVTTSYMLWESTQPERMVFMYLDKMKGYAISHPVEYAINNAGNITMSLATPGLCLLPLLWRPRRPILVIPLLGFLLTFQALYFRELGTMLPGLGNVVTDGGFTMGFAITSPLWNAGVWVAMGIIGVVIFSLYVTTCVEWARDWLRAQKQQGWRARSDNPALILYALAITVAAATFILTPVHFDRYLLPLLPALMLPSLQRMSNENIHTSHTRRWLLIIPLALFSVVGMRDYMAHASVRWQGAEQLVAQGARYNQVVAGFEWMGEHTYADGVKYIRQTHDMSHLDQPALAVLDPAYAVNDLPQPGYTQVGALPYQSWLEGGRTRYILLLKRK